MKNRFKFFALLMLLISAQVTQINAGFWQDFTFQCRTQATSALYFLKQNPLFGAMAGICAYSFYRIFTHKSSAVTSTPKDRFSSSSSDSDDFIDTISYKSSSLESGASSNSDDGVGVAHRPIIAATGGIANSIGSEFDISAINSSADDVGDTPARHVHWGSDSQLEQVQVVEYAFHNKIDQLVQYVNQQVEAILAAIERRNDASAAASAAAAVNVSGLEGSAFEVTDGFDFMELVGELECRIAQLTIPFDEPTKQQAIAQVNELLVKIEEVNSSLAHIQTLIADEGVCLFDRVANNNDVKKVAVSIYELYEFMGLDKGNRNRFSAADMKRIYLEKFNPEMVDRETGMKARQVGFILINEMGKRIYDAFLSDYESDQKGELGHLAMMRIKPQEAEDFGIGTGFIQRNSSILIACMSSLREFKARLE
jgi:hypothetical protein